MGNTTSKSEHHHVHELVKEFSQGEIESLKKFWTLVADSQNHFDLTFFEKTVEPLGLDRKFLYRYSKSLHHPHDRTYAPFLQSMALICKGNREDKAKPLFAFFEPAKGSIVTSDIPESLRLIAQASITLCGINILLEVEDENNLEAAITRMTPSEPKLNYKHFEDWILKYPIILDFYEYVATKFYDPDCSIPPSIELLLEESTLKPVSDDFLVGSSDLLSPDKISQIQKFLPSSLKTCNWVLLYQTRLHGYSLAALFHLLNNRYSQILTPTLLLIQDTNGYVFGGFASELWRKIADNSYGNSSCFIFQLAPSLKFYKSNGTDKHYMHSNEHGLGFGGKDGFHGIWADESFMHGRSNGSLTYGNPEHLSSEPSFQIKTVELWGFIPKERVHLVRRFEEKLRLEKEEEGGKTKSVLDNKEGGFILDLLGKNYSAMIRE